MKRLAARLSIALATFLFSLLVTAALMRVAPKMNAPAPNCDKLPTPSATPAATPDSLQSEPPHAPNKTPRISQQEIVNFPGVGRVRVSADEAFGQPLRLKFEDAASGKRLLEESFYGDGDGLEPDASYPELAPYARFRVMHVAGLPDPLIVGLAVAPGGSDCYWEAVAVGEVNGELEELTREHLHAEDEGGFFFGDLGAGRGLGVVSWDFIWGEYEAHVSPHQYELKVYTWNKVTKRFEWYEVLRTREQFYDGVKAVRSLGFNLRDVRKSFPDFKGFLE